MSCERSHDDGAYVLGALAPAERDAYEKHLSECEECRRAVAQLDGLPGFLGRIPAGAAEQFTDGAAPHGSSLPRLLAMAGERRTAEKRRARWHAAAAAAAAACLVLVAWIGTWALASPDQGGRTTPDVAGASAAPMTAMTPVAGQNRVSAELALSQAVDGTLVRMRCWYKSSRKHEPGKRWRYALVAISRAGETEQIASWSVGLSDKPWISVTTRFPRAELDRLEVRKLDGRAMLRHHL